MDEPFATEMSQRPLFQGERQSEIVSLAIDAGRVDVSALADRFQVTTETIRRDLSELQERKVLRRVHGGAVPWQALRFEPLLTVRSDQQLSEKRRIAAMAAAEIPDSGVMLVDSGSTTARLCEALPRDRDLTVVTNSVLNAQVLSEFDNVEVIILGGTLRKNTMAMVDARAVSMAEELTVDTLFMSCDGFSVERGLSTPYQYEATLKQAMIRAARRVVILADHSKLGNDQLFRFAEWPKVDLLVTDVGVDSNTLDQLRAVVPAVRRA